MNDVLEIWMKQAKEYAADERFTVEEKRRMLAFNAGACWGYAIASKDPNEQQLGFDYRRKINDMQDALASEDMELKS